MSDVWPPIRIQKKLISKMHSIFEYFHLDWFSIRELRSLALQYNSTNPINKEQEWKMQADGGGERRKRDGQRERER